MTLPQCKDERIATAVYGAAPQELVSEYELTTKQMETFFHKGIALSSNIIVELDMKASTLSIEIMKYHL